MRFFAIILLCLLSGCVSVSVEPIKIEHTITLKVEREVDDLLDDLYGEDDPASESTQEQSSETTQVPENSNQPDPEQSVESTSEDSQALRSNPS